MLKMETTATKRMKREQRKTVAGQLRDLKPLPTQVRIALDAREKAAKRHEAL